MIGRTLDSGRFLVTALVAGDRARGMFQAVEQATGQAGLVSVVDGCTDPGGLRRLEDPGVPGVAPVMFLGGFDGPGFAPLALVEREPSGEPLLCWVRAPIPVPRATRLVCTLAYMARGIGIRAGVPAAGLHPRVVYVEEGGEISGLAPRFAHLLDRGAAEWRKPLFSPSFEPPEVLGGTGLPRTEAGDVFTLCAILAWLSTARFPFGDSTIQECAAHFEGAGLRPPVPEVIDGIAGPGLAADPAARPTLASLIQALERLL